MSYLEDILQSHYMCFPASKPVALFSQQGPLGYKYTFSRQVSYQKKKEQKNNR